MNILLSLLVLILSNVISACRFPPNLWCSSEKIAYECKVFDQCKAREWTPQPDAAPVGFELYYESLCGFCQLFINQQLYPTFQKIGGIMNISLIPYGNAKEHKVDDHYVFTCQHGKEECIGNLIETCTIYIVGDIQKYFPFINCLENLGDTPSELLKPCAAKFGMPVDRILACVNSTTGNILQHQMAKKTESLNPPHKYVPWVTLNGVHTQKINDEAQSDLLKLICDTYTGPKPAACQQVTSRCST